MHDKFKFKISEINNILILHIDIHIKLLSKLKVV